MIVTLENSNTSSGATKFIVERAFVSRRYHRRYGPRYRWVVIAEVDAPEDGTDATFEDNYRLRAGTNIVYRYRAINGPQAAQFAYFTVTVPPEPTPLGACESINFYTYTMTHPLPEFTGYFKMNPTGVVVNALADNVFLLYNDYLKMWLLTRVSTSRPVEHFTTATSRDILTSPGVYYYCSSDSKRWVPRNPNLWDYNKFYSAIRDIKEHKPDISCYYALPPEPDPEVTSYPKDPPTDQPQTPPAGPPPTYTPTPTPTYEFLERVVLFHETGVPLLAESGETFIPEAAQPK